MCHRGIKPEDLELIRSEAHKRFFLIVGQRDDQALIQLIPEAENVVIAHQICFYCKANASFAGRENSIAVCRSCREMELERIQKMDKEIRDR